MKKYEDDLAEARAAKTDKQMTELLRSPMPLHEHADRGPRPLGENLELERKIRGSGKQTLRNKEDEEAPMDLFGKILVLSTSA